MGLFYIIFCSDIAFKTLGILNLFWSVLPLLMGAYIYLSTVLKRRYGVFLYLFHLACILYSSTLQADNTIHFDNSLTGVFFRMIMTSVFFVGIVELKGKLSVQLNQELKRLERLDNIKKIIISLNHEIRTPLTTAKISFTRLAENSNPRWEQYYKTCDDSLDKITDLLDKIEKMDTFENEVTYSKQNKMLDLNS